VHDITGITGLLMQKFETNIQSIGGAVNS